MTGPRVHGGATLGDLLALQRRVDDVFADARRRYPHRLCDLGHANPHDRPRPEVLAALRAVLDADRPLQLQYTPYGGRPPARRAAARQLSAVHGLDYEWHDVALTPGAMAALAIAFRCVYEQPGDEVVVITPCWHDCPTYLAAIGLDAAHAPLRRPAWTIDIEAIRARLRSGRVVAVVLSQPSNPTGVLYGEPELGALADALAECARPPLLIADEVHRDFVFAPARMLAPAAFYDRTVTIYSYGKALALQGQRLGYVAVSPRHPERAALAGRLVDACRYTGACTPTALMQHALPALARIAPDLDGVRARRDAITGALRGAGYEVAPGAHTFFVYARSPIADDVRFVERLAGLGLLAVPGALFHDPGWFRLSATATAEMIDAAGAILAEARDGRDASRE